MKKCEHCQTDKDASKFNPDCLTPDVCFSCRVRNVSFTNPIKSGQGSDAWRHDTIRDFQRRQVAEAAANGLEAIPKWHTTNTGTTAGGLKKIADHHQKLSKGKSK